LIINNNTYFYYFI